MYHRLISGWEWIYGDQSMAPSLIQMDGESGSGKIDTLKRYNMWFLSENGTCDREAVDRATRQMEAGTVPRLFSSSKLKQKVLIATGQLLSSLPIFGAIYRTYGGIPSLYLQFF
uniref:ABC transmembrane type-1 domain-containing protein n=1 Tax=Steinernema glaseri TaxID=37863 RepID=A0A1I8AA80_9BILA